MPFKKNKKYKAPNNPIEPMPFTQDIIIALSICMSYRDGLARLGQTCKEMHQWVENTPAGRLARQATQLEPNSINQSLADNYETIGRIMGVLIGTFGLFGSLILGVVTESNAVCISSCVGIGGAGYLIDHGLFKNKKNVEHTDNTIKEMHDQLKTPIQNW